MKTHYEHFVFRRKQNPKQRNIRLQKWVCYEVLPLEKLVVRGNVVFNAELDEWEIRFRWSITLTAPQLRDITNFVDQLNFWSINA